MVGAKSDCGVQGWGVCADRGGGCVVDVEMMMVESGWAPFFVISGCDNAEFKG